MNFKPTLASLLASTFLLFGCAAPMSDSLVLSQSAIKTAAQIAPPATSNLTNSAEAQITITVPYNLGIKGRTLRLQRTSTLSNGLKETITQERIAMGSSASEGVARSISLCGLIPLIIEGGSPGSMGTLVFTGNAGAFTPIGASPSSSMRQITTSLETSSSDICKPTVGSTFSYKTVVKLETNIPPFRRVVDLVETSNCRATDNFENFNALKDAGASLLLTCNINRDALDRPAEKKFVYFPESMEYFEIFIKINDGYFYDYNYTKPPKLLAR